MDPRDYEVVREATERAIKEIEKRLTALETLVARQACETADTFATLLRQTVPTPPVVDLVNRLENEACANRQGRLAEYLTRMDFMIYAPRRTYCHLDRPGQRSRRRPDSASSPVWRRE